MKKVNKKAIIPIKLDEYFKDNPTATWEKFKNECQTGYKTLLTEIKNNQGGVCCYCEITFYDDKGIRDDFRVEHFHPKSDTSSIKNWNLIWTNLLGCCHGGSDRSVLGATRFIQNKKHHHSDVLKGEKPWDDEILNPLSEIPAFPPIFKVSSDGKMKVLKNNCNTTGTSIKKAENCLDEKKLNLNSPVLIGWRKTVIDKLRSQTIKTNDINLIRENMEELLLAHLAKDSHGNFRDFFTTVRSYLEEDAEVFLKQQNYDG
jgi:uncharacterized protein (TIGR02646 family)